MERFLVNVEEYRHLPPTLYGSRLSGSIGRALHVAVKTTQARGEDVASGEGSTGRPIYRLDEYEVRKRTFRTSLQRWGVCVIAPMLNAEWTQVDALGLAGIDGGTDFVVALRLISEKYQCSRMEAIENYFPELHEHLINERAATVVTSLQDFKVLVEAGDRRLASYAPLYDGLVLGALAQPGWVAGLRDVEEREVKEDLAGAALSYGYFRRQGFPCDEIAWRRAFAEEPMPGSRIREKLCSWPHAGEPRRGFSSKQKRWVVLNLKVASLALLEVVQTSMRRSVKEKPVDFLWHEVQKTMVGMYPYDPARTLTWRDMMELEAEPRIKVEPLSPTQEKAASRTLKRRQSREDAAAANSREEATEKRTEKRTRNSKVALVEAPSALGYDPEAPPKDIRARLGPLPVQTRFQVDSEGRIRARLPPEAESGQEEEQSTTTGREAPAPPRHLKEVRRQQRERQDEGPRDGVAEATLTRRNRRTLKRYFTAISSNQTALYPKTFLGPMLCHQCGQKVHRTELCWVTLWKEGAALPRNRTMPCMYCRSRQHAVDACSYLHHRCLDCGLLGHVRAECRDRSSSSWKRMFLECAEYGVLTGRNPFGPLRGRFGLGAPVDDPETRAIADEVRDRLQRRAIGEGWLMENHPSFQEAVEEKRKEDHPFDLWWRGVMEDDDVERMRARLGDCHWKGARTKEAPAESERGRKSGRPGRGSGARKPRRG